MSTSPTIDPAEARHFGTLAKAWWDPQGSSAMLHRLNPVRLQFLREAIDLHWGGDIESAKPLAGKRRKIAEGQKQKRRRRLTQSSKPKRRPGRK